MKEKSVGEEGHIPDICHFFYTGKIYTDAVRASVTNMRYGTALCAVRKVYFSAQPNNLKLILNFQKYYPVEHIFVPACSSARKEHFFKF